MNELQEVIDKTTGQLAHAAQAASYAVLLGTGEAKTLVDAAQLVGPLQDRCQLLGRALAAVWSLVGEEDQRALMAVLDVPAGSGKTAPALSLVQMLERKGATVNDGGIA